MRKVSFETCSALLAGKARCVGNTAATTSGELRLHGNRIAWIERMGFGHDDVIHITDAGWRTATTKERLNTLLELAGCPARIYQRDFEWRISHSGQGSDCRWTGEYQAVIRR